MKENKKSHVTNIIRRTATLTRRDWDNHILSGQNGGMAGWQTGEGKCPSVGPSYFAL